MNYLCAASLVAQLLTNEPLTNRRELLAMQT